MRPMLTRRADQPGLFFAETNGHQNIGNARSNTYKGSSKPDHPKIKMVERSGSNKKIDHGP